MIIPINENSSLGAITNILSKHMYSEEVTRELSRFPSQAIIGLGQGGGRIAAELARFGFPTFLFNSSKSDMDEHKSIIPENRRILTKSENYPHLEGTDKNAKLGYEIALENKDLYAKVLIDDAIQDAEFVWVCVSLGGGTGNGALKVALTLLSKIRQAKALPDGKIPLGVICSLPSKDERGSSFRQNALAGISLIQSFMDQNKIGAALVIDNEKMNNYYATQPLKTYSGNVIDAKSYTNMIIASTIAEVLSIPLLEGRVVLDKTELLSTLSTPGWLSISKLTVTDNDNLEEMINNLFSNNEILANYSVKNALTGAVAVMNPTSRNISPKMADDVYMYTSKLLDVRVNLSITKNSKIDKVTLYGLAVYLNPSLRIKELRDELEQWKKIEQEQQRARKEAAPGLLDEFDDFFTVERKNQKKGKITLDDLDLDTELEDTGVSATSQKKKKKFEVADLQDLDF